MAKYTTKKRDTLQSLADKYGVSRKQLRDLNPDTKFGNEKKGFNSLGKNNVIRLGKGVGQPQWKAELLEDPTYAAFANQFGYNRSKIQSDFLALKDKMKRDLGAYEHQQDLQQVKNYRGIDQTMENRGLFRSGQRHMERGRSELDAENAYNTYKTNQDETRETGRRAKWDAIGDMKRKRSSERIAARSRLTDRDATTKFMGA